MERFSDARELQWLVDRTAPPPPPDPEAKREQDDLARQLEEFVARDGATIEEGNVVSFLGLDAEGWAQSAWILHAMYESSELPAEVTWDDVDRMKRAARSRRRFGLRRQREEQNVAVDAVAELLAGGMWPPGPGWERLRWVELWDRFGVDPAGLEGVPFFGWFPYRSWPVNLSGPDEGSLDREQLVRLLGHLEVVSALGGKTPCIASYGACAIGEFDHDVLYRGVLRDVITLLDDDVPRGSPSNFWPEDRSWLVYTNWDLWGTKVSGDADLVGRLDNDPELEVVRLPLA